jgi:hypothetical protein
VSLTTEAKILIAVGAAIGVVWVGWSLFATFGP